MERGSKVTQAMPGFRVCTSISCKIEDFFFFNDVDWRFWQSSLDQELLDNMCVDRAEEMTRGSVSGKMTQLEGLQTVKCDDGTISYETSLSTFTSGHVSLIMMFH